MFSTLPQASTRNLSGLPSPLLASMCWCRRGAAPPRNMEDPRNAQDERTHGHNISDERPEQFGQTQELVPLSLPELAAHGVILAAHILLRLAISCSIVERHHAPIAGEGDAAASSWSTARKVVVKRSRRRRSTSVFWHMPRCGICTVLLGIAPTSGSTKMLFCSGNGKLHSMVQQGQVRSLRQRCLWRTKGSHQRRCCFSHTWNSRYLCLGQRQHPICEVRGPSVCTQSSSWRAKQSLWLPAQCLRCLLYNKRTITRELRRCRWIGNN